MATQPHRALARHVVLTADCERRDSAAEKTARKGATAREDGGPHARVPDEFPGARFFRVVEPEADRAM
jgi:hypothetical protein